MAKTRLILVGGFLGAGKTTLLLQAARRLRERGLSVGLITNDQANDLVDTRILQEQGLNVQQVSGGCFCCRFSCLLSASELLSEARDNDVLLAEPVGSCTDISATVLQPIKAYYSSKFAAAPFTVLVDPERLRSLLDAPAASSPGPAVDPLPSSVWYIVRKQMEEADLIVLNKIDRLGGPELAELTTKLSQQYPQTRIAEISALTGDGLDAWLDMVLADGAAGAKIASVDYDVYSAGEAVLGWLNASIELRSPEPLNWEDFCRKLLGRMQEELRTRSAETAHMKLFCSAPGGKVIGNVVSTLAQPSILSDLPGRTQDASLVFNARVHIGPDELRHVFLECLNGLAEGSLEVHIKRLDSLQAGRPQPTHRFSDVVDGPRRRMAQPARGWRRKARIAITVLLLAFVATGVTAFVVQEIRAKIDTGARASGAASCPAALPEPTDGVGVYYLHLVKRCGPCLTMERWTREEIEKTFAKEIADGKLLLCVASYGQPESRSLSDKYGLYLSTVLIIENRNGRTVRWEELHDLSRLLNDREAFASCLRAGVRKHLRGGE